MKPRNKRRAGKHLKEYRDAVYGIGSGDYEIMNKGGFDEDMKRQKLMFSFAVRSAPEVNQELVEASERLKCASKSSGYPHER